MSTNTTKKIPPSTPSQNDKSGKLAIKVVNSREKDEENARIARKNWKALRSHIDEMKHTANYLVIALEEANEAKQQQEMNGQDVIGDKGSNFIGQDNQKEGEVQTKKCLQHIIIHPKKSGWLGLWVYIINSAYMIGFFHDPIHISLFIYGGQANSADSTFLVEKRERDMTIFYVMDVLLALNIVIKSLT